VCLQRALESVGHEAVERPVDGRRRLKRATRAAMASANQRGYDGRTKAAASGDSAAPRYGSTKGAGNSCAPPRDAAAMTAIDCAYAATSAEREQTIRRQRLD